MLYDDQASTFDERAGFSDETLDSIAQAVVDFAGLREGDRFLEIGAGTGLLSIRLLARPIHYIGFDRSPEMIRVFRERIADMTTDAELCVADGDGRWPADDHTINAIFSSRALHHLGVEHVVSETLRVLDHVGGWLVTGNVVRPRDSVRQRMRREMRRRLETMGHSGRSHERHAHDLFARLGDHGGKHAGPIVAARWTRMVAPADSLRDWEHKQGLAGVALSSDEKSKLLDDLHAWSTREFGDAERAVEQEEWYELEGMRIVA